MPDQEYPPISKMNQSGIIPGSITISQGESYTPTGSIVLSSTLDFSIKQTREKNFSWRVGGLLEKEIGFNWSTGEGEYYWYRVEGECGKVDCDNSGIDASQCNKMTFITIVSGRNVTDVCDALNSPRLNPPVNLRVASIRRFARPVLKTSGTDIECNTLEDQEFCHIPECLDYCIDETAKVSTTMSMTSIDFIRFREMTGGLHVGGSSETDRSRRYDPDSPLTVVTGQAISRLTIKPIISGGLTFSGGSERTLSHLSLSFSGGPSIFGSSRTTSPSGNFSFVGGLSLSAPDGSSAFTSYEMPTEQSSISLVSGSSDFLLSLNPSSSGLLEVSGAASDYISPSYFYRPSGGAVFEGEAERNFDGLGVISFGASARMDWTSLSSYFDEANQFEPLTISDYSVTTPCGCGDLNLSIKAKHNLFGSNVLGKFLNRNNLSFSDTAVMRYRAFDATWFSNQHLSGPLAENWSIIFSLSCRTDVWRFVFSADKLDQGKKLQTKFIIDMPSEFICADQRISTRISLGVSSPANLFSGAAVPVTSPAPVPVGSIVRNSVLVDESIFDYVVYYDNIGLFKDSYWSKTPFVIQIDPASATDMPLANLQKVL